MDTEANSEIALVALLFLLHCRVGALSNALVELVAHSFLILMGRAHVLNRTTLAHYVRGEIDVLVFRVLLFHWQSLTPFGGGIALLNDQLFGLMILLWTAKECASNRTPPRILTDRHQRLSLFDIITVFWWNSNIAFQEFVNELFGAILVPWAHALSAELVHDGIEGLIGSFGLFNVESLLGILRENIHIRLMLVVYQTSAALLMLTHVKGAVIARIWIHWVISVVIWLDWGLQDASLVWHLWLDMHCTLRRWLTKAKFSCEKSIQD